MEERLWAMWWAFANPLLFRIDVEQEKTTFHHWPFSRWYHVVLVSLVAMRLAPKRLRQEAVWAALVHDMDNRFNVSGLTSWRSFWRYWWTYLWATTKPEEPARMAAQLGLSPDAVRGVRDHMKKANPQKWHHQMTAILMAADALGHMLEYVMWPWWYKKIRRINATTID